MLKVAIVGRPNVGKSALFNRICKKRIAIVDEAEGITRDRLYATAEFAGRAFMLIDTGGISSNKEALFSEEIKYQAYIAIEEADICILVVDAQVGLTEWDEQVAKVLIKANKPLCLAINKVDDLEKEGYADSFYALGIADMQGVSAAHGHSIYELLEMAFSKVSLKEEEEEDGRCKVAIVGRPNVGKSTLINQLLDEKRCIVSPLAGTTRDSIDISFTYEDEDFLLIDTAGIKKKQSEKELVEKFAAIRTERAIERADICILILDSVSGITHQDKRIVNAIERAGKGCLILFNKWDLVKGYRMDAAMQSFHMECPFAVHCPSIFISALEERNLDKIFPLVQEVNKARHQRITTGCLNTFIERCMQSRPPPMVKAKRLKVYYMTQIHRAPPTFIFFVNKKEYLTRTYRKYLYNQFRKEFSLTGNPVIFLLRGKKLQGNSHQYEQIAKVGSSLESAHSE